MENGGMKNGGGGGNIVGVGIPVAPPAVVDVLAVVLLVDVDVVVPEIKSKILFMYIFRWNFKEHNFYFKANKLILLL